MPTAAAFLVLLFCFCARHTILNINLQNKLSGIMIFSEEKSPYNKARFL